MTVSRVGRSVHSTSLNHGIVQSANQTEPFGPYEVHEKNGFVTATKLGTTNKIFVTATKHFAATTKRFVDRTEHFVVVTISF